jgi:tripartite-type tricarboxylate transporter receptor subunit TctC
MKSTRRTFLQIAGATVATPAFSRAATAQTTYPTRPITMIVPYAAGGAPDVIGRVLAERMKGSLEQPFIIENVGGADGSIGTGRVARARPNGYTIVLGLTGTHVLNGAFYSLPYDLLNDFAPVSPLGTGSLVLSARKNMPAENLNELIAWLRGNPNRASAGFGGGDSHLATAFFQKVTGTQFVLVPYRGGGPAIQDLVAGQIDLYFAGSVFIPLVLPDDRGEVVGAVGGRVVGW